MATSVLQCYDNDNASTTASMGLSAVEWSKLRDDTCQHFTAEQISALPVLAQIVAQANKAAAVSDSISGITAPSSAEFQLVRPAGKSNSRRRVRCGGGGSAANKIGAQPAVAEPRLVTTRGARGTLTLQLHVPDDGAGLLIGHGGENLAAMRAFSGAQIEIEPLAPGRTLRVCAITGSPEQLQRAHQIIQTKLATRGLTVEPTVLPLSAVDSRHGGANFAATSSTERSALPRTTPASLKPESCCAAGAAAGVGKQCTGSLSPSPSPTPPLAVTRAPYGADASSMCGAGHQRPQKLKGLESNDVPTLLVYPEVPRRAH